MRRLLDAVSKTLEPSSRFLASRYPMVWRTRIGPCLAVLLAVHASCWILASLWPVSTRSIPSIERLHGAFLGLQGVLGLAVLAWLVSATRQGLGPTPWRWRWTAVLCHAIACFVALAGPLVVAEHFIGRLADLVPDETLAAESELHGRYGFWRCDRRIDSTAFALHSDAIRAAVVKYHRTDGDPPLHLEVSDRVDSKLATRPAGCSAGGRYAVFKDARSARSGTWLAVDLRSPIESLTAAQSMREDVGPHASWLGRGLWIALLLSTVFGAAPLVVDRLGRIESTWHGLLPAWPRPPEPLVRLDRRLVTRSPIAWSTGLHRFLTRIAVVSLGVALPMTLLARATGVSTFWRWWIDAWEYDETLQGLLFLVVLMTLVALVWWRFQRGCPHDPRSVREDVLIVGLGIVATIGAPVLSLTIFLLVDPWTWRDASALGTANTEGVVDLVVFYGSLLGVFGVVFQMLSRRLGTATAIAVSVASFLGLMAQLGLTMLLEFEAEPMLWLAAAPGLVCGLIYIGSLRVRSPGRAIVAIRATAVLAGLPSLLVALLSAEAELGSLDLEIGDGLLIAITIIVMWLLTLTMMALLSGPLRHWHDQPKR